MYLLYFLAKLFRWGDGVVTLTDDRKKEIAEIAQKIIMKNEINPFNFDLVRYLSEYENFEIQLQLIDDDTTGLLFVDDKDLIPKTNSHRLIVVNQRLINDDEFIQKRRFICAHEYGHYILHKGKSPQFAKRDTHNKDDEEELEAEYFAYCLLMPENQLKYLFNLNRKTIEIIKNKCNMNDIDIVSVLFNVSKKKAYNRLNELGMLPDV